MSTIENYLQEATEKIASKKQNSIRKPSHTIRNLQIKVLALEEEQKDLKNSLEILTNSYDELRKTFLTLSDTLEKNLL